MASLNKVFLIGNLTRDPEVRYTPSGKAVGDLRLAVNRRYKTADGENRAETCGEYLRKGSPLLAEGRLQYDEWEKDGQKHNRLRVVAERVQFLSGSKSGEGRDGSSRKKPVDSEERQEAPRAESGDSGDDDNLPF